MRSHAAAPNPMNHASPTLEWSPTTALCGRLLKAAASMSRLSLNALSACADDARNRVCSSFDFVQLACGCGTRHNRTLPLCIHNKPRRESRSGETYDTAVHPRPAPRHATSELRRHSRSHCQLYIWPLAGRFGCACNRLRLSLRSAAVRPLSPTTRRAHWRVCRRCVAAKSSAAAFCSDSLLYAALLLASSAKSLSM
jgi:hypothetical protein